MSTLRARIKRNRVLRGAVFAAQNLAVAGSFRSAGLIGVTAPQTPRHHLAAMIRVKDEARFLPEWLAHHVALGFEHVYVYDNNSADGLEQVIAPFVERGLVTYVPWPTVPASPSSHLDFLARFGAANEWVAFFDADEFLVEASPGALVDVLAGSDAPAIAVNYRYFGSSGHDRIPEGLITAAFDHADLGLDPHVKVIARPAMVRRYRNPHNWYYRRGRLARTPDGRRVFGTFVTPSDVPRLVLRHYVYRSREDYSRKVRRGFADAAGVRDAARSAELIEREFRQHNDVRAPVPGQAVEATAGLLRELGYPTRLYEASSPADLAPS